MAEPLWSFAALLAAACGRADGPPPAAVTGLSIDTRTIAPGEAFVALKDRRDGHDFVTEAFARGAAAALVSEGYVRQPGDGALIRVADTLDALVAIARAARARLAPDARVVAVTGSAGKTTTKEMLRACFEALAPGHVHASAKSFNNHWGVPLTLATMPAATRFAVLEIGMNHAGEITPLTCLARPHVAIVLNVLPAHLGHFASVEEIAEAKAEIFAGLEPGGTAILNGASPHADLLRRRVPPSAMRTLSFGFVDPAVTLEAAVTGYEEAGADPLSPVRVELSLAGQRIGYALAVPGRHIAENSAAALLAVRAAGGDIARAAAALAGVGAAPGRGERIRVPIAGGELLLVDESYNANPASMAAAIHTTGAARSAAFPRLVLALGDMLELGDQSVALHRGLQKDVDAVRADLVFASGPHMKALWDALDPARRGAWGATSKDIEQPLLAALRPGDVVMVKGSNGSRMTPLVAAIKALAVRGAA